jgi:predicted naringenin-chalcone synthase
LQALGAGLGLTDDDLAVSYRILKDYGNMSSATILFVLKDTWENLWKIRAPISLLLHLAPDLLWRAQS